MELDLRALAIEPRCEGMSQLVQQDRNEDNHHPYQEPKDALALHAEQKGHEEERVAYLDESP